ncbi:LANO_0F17370g1_1 [Lachancea nothofagi CBS 11611]|uniref:LANO_0F17370g1_1 n=1 Tax=Lachancea nothofagi CBS 11611 TaxID=1266666 RepID=A0A1G4KDD8_9SACH|nr:LANO_0F17370g1_1 [Lachancea nothofagi CBS 11611]
MDDGCLIDFLLEDELTVTSPDPNSSHSKWLADDGTLATTSAITSTKSGRRNGKSKPKKRRKELLQSQIEDPIEDLIDLILKEDRLSLNIGRDLPDKRLETTKPKSEGKKKSKNKARGDRIDLDRRVYESIAKDKSFMFNFPVNELLPDMVPEVTQKKSKKRKPKEKKSSNDQDHVQSRPTREPEFIESSPKLVQEPLEIEVQHKELKKSSAKDKKSIKKKKNKTSIRFGGSGALTADANSPTIKNKHPNDPDRPSASKNQDSQIPSVDSSRSRSKRRAKASKQSPTNDKSVEKKVRKKTSTRQAASEE